MSELKHTKLICIGSRYLLTSPRVLGKTLKKLVTSWKFQKCSRTVSLITH